jgi:hypothetical protein
MEFLLSRVMPNATRHTPYATHCIRSEFTIRHEERMSAKETNIVLAKFALSPKGIVKGTNRWINGTLLYNLNAENHIAAYILSVDLEGITVADVVRLKHAFYKRRVVTIRRSTLPDVSLCVSCQDKNGKCNYGCLNRSNELSKKERTTFPMFVLDYVNPKDVRLDIDFRARYSLLEVEEEHKPELVDLYALITSDEGYEEVPKKVMENALQNMSTRNSFDYYCYGTNVLLVTNKEQYAESVLHKNLFHQGYEHPSNHIPEEECILHSCFAGVGKGVFKSFIRAVEIHYMVNTATTNETVLHTVVKLNPYKVVRRVWGLWLILHDIDSNKYYINAQLNERFSINSNIEKLRKEFKELLAMIASYAAIIISIIAILSIVRYFF